MSYPYADKAAFLAELGKRADLFIAEFDAVAEADKDSLRPTADRTPAQMLAYQLGWMKLVLAWDAEEAAGRQPVMPAPGFKWNALGPLYQHFYAAHAHWTLAQMRAEFAALLARYQAWIGGLTQAQLFQQGYRRWTGDKPQWPLARWIHINTVAPFKTFRSKIRAWKKVGGC
ncbi:MAG: ClbS/DfsB family four-helix bundle protein [Brachymonas sp.]|nr:ClbS/DfsB family four-helix bundle protein [Brachymonas sp.]